MSNKQHVSDKSYPANGQAGMQTNPVITEGGDNDHQGGPGQHGRKFQPRHISQKEAQSLPIDQDPDDPVSP